MDFNPSESRGRKFIAVKSTQVFLLAAIVLMTLVITVLCIGFLVQYEVRTDVWNVDSVGYWKEDLAKEQKYWYNDGIEELKVALKISWELQDAQNVIIFMTHGIGEAALAAARFNGNTDGIQKLVWDEFSHIGNILRCYTFDANSFGTALFGGVQTTPGIAGLDGAVATQNCTQSMNETHHIKSILSMAQQSDFRNGFVTTGRVSGPLMSALYAHTANTSWECDANVPSSKVLQGCKDIATQLIDDETGIGMNVIMGGGRQTLVSSVHVSTWDPVDRRICNSLDGRNYIRDWRTLKRSNQQRNAVLQNAFELNRLNGSDVDFVLGIFANGNMKPPWEHNTIDNHMPKLSDMVEKALEVLKRAKERFLLVVESGNGLRGKNIAEQIEELKQLNETMEKAMKIVSADTLFLVLFVDEEFVAGRTDDTETFDDPDRILTGNIKILAAGPSSYLFHGLHDSTYMTHAIALALKIGPFRKPV